MSLPAKPPSSPHDALAVPGRSRAGFTLAELIVALMLLSVGLLALSSTSAFVTYELAASERSERAASVAASKLELLPSSGCADAVGSSTADGITTAWSVATAGRGATASVEVTYAERGKRLSQLYSSGFTCLAITPSPAP